MYKLTEQLYSKLLILSELFLSYTCTTNNSNLLRTFQLLVNSTITQILSLKIDEFIL